MKTIILILFYIAFLFPQSNISSSLDTLIYINGNIIIGEVSLIKSQSIDFINIDDGINYVILKSTIAKILLKNGKVLEFNIIKSQRSQNIPNANIVSTVSDNLISNYKIYGVIIGFNAGYGMLNMSKVNDDLKDSENIFSKAGLRTTDPNKILGGMYIGGNLEYRFSQIAIGTTATYIFSSGEFSYSDPTGSFEETYDVSTVELMGLLEAIIGAQNSTVNFFVQLNAGIGLASAKHLGSFQLFSNSSNNIKVTNDVSGQYFCGKLKTGLYFNLVTVLLEISAGYRLSNSGVLKGNHTENGVTYKNMAVRDLNGNGIEFDYSGPFISAGLHFIL